MKTITEHIRDHILLNAFGGSKATYKDSIDVIENDFSLDFVTKMANRIVMGHHRYGPVKNAKTDNIKAVKDRVGKYEETGNMEYLVDAGNFLMLEYHFPKHPKAHFESVDDGEHAT